MSLCFLKTSARRILPILDRTQFWNSQGRHRVSWQIYSLDEEYGNSYCCCWTAAPPVVVVVVRCCCCCCSVVITWRGTPGVLLSCAFSRFSSHMSTLWSK